MASDVQVNTVEVAVESSAESAVSSIGKLITKLDELDKKIGEVVSKAGGLSNLVKIKQPSNSNPFKSFEKQAKTAGNAAKTVYKEVKNYADEMKRFGVDTEQKGVKFLYGEDKMSTNRAKMFNREHSGEWAKATKGVEFEKHAKELNEQIAASYKSAAASLKEEIATRKSSTALWEKTKAFKEQAAAAQEVIDEIERQKLIGNPGPNDILVTEQGIEQLYAMKAALRDVKEQAILLGKVTYGVFSRLGKAARAAMNPIKLLHNGLKKIRDGLGLGRSGRGGLFGSGRSFGRFLGLMLLRRAIMSVIRALVGGIKEGSDNLAKYSADYNNSISSMRSALTYLKNAWAAAFAPIVNVVAPYINAFISMLASALNAIGRFLAALTGKGFAVQAKPVWQNYADSLGGAASGAGKAAKAAKEYQKTLMSFDQIHALNSPDNGSGGSGGGGGGGGSDGLSVQDMFETVSIESSMMDFANKIRDAIAKDDWFGVGQIIADKMNEAIDKALENDAFNKFGERVAKKLNRAIDLFAGWSTTFDFADLGKGIGQAINSALNGLHWENLGLGLGAFTNGLWAFVKNAIEEVHWDELGMNIRDGIATYFDTVNWTEIRQTLSKAFEALLDFCIGLLDDNKLGQAILDGLDEFFANIKRSDVVRIGAKLAKFILQVVQFAVELGSMSPLAKLLGLDADLDLSELFAPFYAELDKLIEKNEAAGKSTDKIMEGYEGSAGESAKWLMQLKKETQKGAKEIQKEATKTGKGIETSASTTGKNTVKTASKTANETAQKIRGGQGSMASATSWMLAPLPTLFSRMLDHAKQTGVDIPTEMSRGTSMYATYVYGAAQGLMDKYGGGIRSKLDIVKGKAKEIYDGVKQKIDLPAPFKTIGEKIVSSLVDGLGSGNPKSKLTTAANNVIEAIKKAFGGGSKTGAVYNTGYSLGQSVVNGINAGIRSLGIAKLEYKLKYDTINGNRVATGLNPTKSYVQLAAEGGFLRSGEMFIARERGPEMVGRIGNRNAVANNQQIIEGIESGVARGVLSAMSASNNPNGSAPYEIHITVKTQSDEVLARAVERGNAQRRYRLGTAMG